MQALYVLINEILEQVFVQLLLYPPFCRLMAYGQYFDRLKSEINVGIRPQ